MPDEQLTLEITLTPEGYERLRAELEELVSAARPAIADLLRSAYESGEDGASPQVIAASREHERLERRIARLEETLRQARVVPRADLAEDVVRIGSTVALRRGGAGSVERYTLVGPTEGDARQARISSQSPLGRALIGRRRGETVRVAMPRGDVEVRLDEVRAAG
jgi:transcription elongation factor GreA